jgi:hypothetical protein
MHLQHVQTEEEVPVLVRARMRVQVLVAVLNRRL